MSVLYPPLLAREFHEHTLESFLEHVSSLKRAPERSRKPSKAPRLPALKCALVKGAHAITLSAGSASLMLSYAEERQGRKRLKCFKRSALELASKALLRDMPTLEAFFVKKTFLLED